MRGNDRHKEMEWSQSASRHSPSDTDQTRVAAHGGTCIVEAALKAHLELRHKQRGRQRTTEKLDDRARTQNPRRMHLKQVATDH